VELFEINARAFAHPFSFYEKDPRGEAAAQAVIALHFELLAVAWAADGAEIEFLVSNYLVRSKKWLETRTGSDFNIAADGWAFLEAAKPNRASPFAFVAMSFDPMLTGLFIEGIEPAVQQSGYAALRVDRHEHINRIDDEIISQLRRSRFCVADLTGQKAGVYYEAGFAQGFNLPVIWSCRHDQLKKVHFDTRQFNILLWKHDGLIDFHNRLKNRIEAVIGAGPKPSSA